MALFDAPDEPSHPTRPSTPLFSDRLESALRFAAFAHRDQVRKSSSTPYVQHVVAVSVILDRAGFGEDVVIAALLHDVVEDTPTTLEEVAAEFGAEVARLVDYCSEVRLDGEGRKRPWIDRKTDHLAHLAGAPVEARAIALADKLHNLTAVAFDIDAGVDVWSAFNADRERVLWYYDAVIQACGDGDPRLERLAQQCRGLLSRIAS